MVALPSGSRLLPTSDCVGLSEELEFRMALRQASKELVPAHMRVNATGEFSSPAPCWRRAETQKTYILQERSTRDERTPAPCETSTTNPTPPQSLRCKRQGMDRDACLQNLWSPRPPRKRRGRLPGGLHRCVLCDTKALSPRFHVNLKYLCTPPTGRPKQRTSKKHITLDGGR